MKLNSLFATALLVGSMLCAPVFAAYQAPTDAELDKLLANPKLAPNVLEDATGAQAAELLSRIIERIRNAGLGETQVNYLISYWSARIIGLIPVSERVAFVQDIVATAPAATLPSVYAGLAIGGAGDTAVINALKEAAGNDTALQTAISSPSATLSQPVYNQLVNTLASAQTLPPAPNNTTPPSAGVAGTGAGTGTAAGGGAAAGGGGGGIPPPVPEPYAGQG